MGEYAQWFNPKLKDIVRKKFGNKCFICGKRQTKKTRKLSIHHINGDKLSEDINNLVPLCQSCHAKYGGVDGVHKIITKLRKNGFTTESESRVIRGLPPEYSKWCIDRLIK